MQLSRLQLAGRKERVVQQQAGLAAHIHETDGFTPAERARLKAMTDSEIERAAQVDPDAAPLDPAALQSAVAKRGRRQNTAKIAV